MLCCSLTLEWIRHSISPSPWTAQDSHLLHAVLTCCEQLHHHCHHQQWYVVSVMDGACLAWPIPFILPTYTAACPPALRLAVQDWYWLIYTTVSRGGPQLLLLHLSSTSVWAQYTKSMFVDIGVTANLESVDVLLCRWLLRVDGDADAAMENRIQIGWNKFRQLVPLPTNEDISLIVRGRLYSGCVRSSMLHGSED